MNLEEKIKLPCGAVISNRFGKAALSERLADDFGNPTEKLEHLYRRWSHGGAGLLLSGHVMSTWQCYEAAGNVVITEKSERKAFERWAEAGTSAGNHFWMQINHTGRQTLKYVSSKPVAPSEVSAVKMLGLFKKPRALQDDEIETLISKWANAALFAKETGFTGVQIHSAHGYLNSQFLSPATNLRTDRWGGSIENRARFLLEIIRQTRKLAGPKFPISVKLNSADFQRGGFNEEDSMRVVEMLEAEGIDHLEISGGTYENPPSMDASADVKESTLEREAYFIEYAKKIREITKLPLMVTGGFRSLEGMKAAVKKGATDMIGLGRPMIMAPEIVREMLAGKIERVDTDPPSPFFMKSLAHMGELIWGIAQINRLGNGLEPDPKMSVNKVMMADTFQGPANVKRQVKRLKKEGHWGKF